MNAFERFFEYMCDERLLIEGAKRGKITFILSYIVFTFLFVPGIFSGIIGAYISNISKSYKEYREKAESETKEVK